MGQVGAAASTGPARGATPQPLTERVAGARGPQAGRGSTGPRSAGPAAGSPYFGWEVVCGASKCSNGGSQWLSVELLELNMQETREPYLVAPDGLWQSSGWIRGSWTLHLS